MSSENDSFTNSEDSEEWADVKEELQRILERTPNIVCSLDVLNFHYDTMKHMDAIKEYILSKEYSRVIQTVMRSRSYVAEYMRFWVELVPKTMIEFQIKFAFIKPIPDFFGLTLEKPERVKYYSPNSIVGDFRIELDALQISRRSDHKDVIMNELCHQQLCLHHIVLPRGYIHTFGPTYLQSVQFSKCRCVIA